MVGLVGLAAGIIIWIVTMSSAPRYSYGPNQDLGSDALWPALAAAVVILVLIARRTPATLVGAAVAVGPVLLAPWTTPRGDNDGLWILILPMIFGFGIALVLLAEATSRVREYIRRG